MQVPLLLSPALGRPCILLALALTCASCGSSDVAPTGAPSGAGASAEASGAPADAGDTGIDAAGQDATPDGPVSDRPHCKRGVAYGHHSVADLTALSPSVSWWYNWAYVPDEAVRAGSYRDLGVEYVPMVWGESFDQATIAAEIPQGARTLLGFNEPNFFSQANMPASRAAELWPALEAIAQQRNLQLVSPAVNYCGGECHDTDPVSYLDAFFAACPGCRVDAIAVHVYVGCNPGGDNHAQWLIEKVERYKAAYTQPIWVTEFACDNATSLDEQKLFLQDAVTWLENEPRVARYAWFAGRADNVPYVDLLGDDGQLTVLGDAYVSAPQAAGCSL